MQLEIPMLADLVARTAKDVLHKNSTLVARLASERKRFENWLQLEILKSLMDEYPSIEIEKAFPGSNERCDFWLAEANGSQSWLELKLCVTNYCSVYTDSPSSRPITNQVSEIVRDVEKLNRLPSSYSRSVFLIAYPLPDAIQCHPAWSVHIEKFRQVTKSFTEMFVLPVTRNGKSAFISGYALFL
jgi:DNA-binding sugar fermentation-stimulating protein